MARYVPVASSFQTDPSQSPGIEGGRNGGKGKRIKAKQEDGGAGASRARKSYGASSTSNGRPLPQGKRAGSVRKARGRPKGAHPPQAKAFRARLMELVDSSECEANGDSVIAEEELKESEERHHGSVPDTCGAVGEKDAEERALLRRNMLLR